MNVQEQMLDEFLRGIEGQDYRVRIDGSVDEDAAVIDLHIQVFQADDRPLCDVMMKGRITNPLEFGAEVIVALGAFGLCVAGGVIRFVGQTAYESYAASATELPELAPTARCGDLFKRLLANADRLRNAVAGAVAGCVAKTALGAAM